jgi:Rod binding domain-containing protein
VAISPPSDIVLDVARAVDPAGIAEARAQLIRRSQGAGTVPFDAGTAPASSSPDIALGRTADRPSMPDASKKFEAMVLQTFISSMMPKDTQGVYGEGMAGEMWKSMMAEKIAGVVAERGGIGIAEHVLGDFEMNGDKIRPLAGVTPQAEALSEEKPAAMASVIVDQFQRRLARDLAADAETSGLFKTDLTN